MNTTPWLFATALAGMILSAAPAGSLLAQDGDASTSESKPESKPESESDRKPTSRSHLLEQTELEFPTDAAQFPRAVLGRLPESIFRLCEISVNTEACGKPLDKLKLQVEPIEPGKDGTLVRMITAAAPAESDTTAASSDAPKIYGRILFANETVELQLNPNLPRETLHQFRNALVVVRLRSYSHPIQLRTAEEISRFFLSFDSRQQRKEVKLTQPPPREKLYVLMYVERLERYGIAFKPLGPLYKIGRRIEVEFTDVDGMKIELAFKASGDSVRAELSAEYRIADATYSITSDNLDSLRNKQEQVLKSNQKKLARAQQDLADIAANAKKLQGAVNRAKTPAARAAATGSLAAARAKSVTINKRVASSAAIVKRTQTVIKKLKTLDRFLKPIDGHIPLDFAIIARTRDGPIILAHVGKPVTRQEYAEAVSSR